MTNSLIKLPAARRFVRDDSGATAIEYGLIAGLIAVAVITVLVTLGPKIADQFEAIETKIGTTNAG